MDFLFTGKPENARKYVISRAPDRKITNNFAVSHSQLIILGECAKEKRVRYESKEPANGFVVGLTGGKKSSK
jgi:hypothetical protein